MSKSACLILLCIFSSYCLKEESKLKGKPFFSDGELSETLENAFDGDISTEFASSSKDVQYLYSSGNEFNSVTGGWFATNSQSNGRTEKLNNNLHIFCSRTGSSSSRYTTTNSIDMSKYTKLHVVYNIVFISYDSFFKASYNSKAFDKSLFLIHALIKHP